MLAKLKTYSILGIEAIPVEVEVDVSPVAVPKTVLVGLPEAAVRESTHRIERAIVNSGFDKPRDRIVINLAPAELPKQAATFDLPIAAGILIGSGQLDPEVASDYVVVGELALDGSIRPAKGALSMAIQLAKENDLKGMIVPRANACEAAVVEGIDVIPVERLSEAVAFLSGSLPLDPVRSPTQTLMEEYSQYDFDFADVRGQEVSKRAITIAAGGAHNLLMVGPPGSGKSMLAKRIATVMPPLTPGESIETSRIYSSMGKLPSGMPLLVKRPFRSPHHTISDAGLVGGGNPPAPGEISFSHNGVLFLDELPEFNRKTLEVMRQPLEDGVVTISRAHRSTTFPSELMLIAAMNPCPCGFRTEPRRDCHCSVPQIERYMAKISGPLLDRIDIHIEVPAVDYKELSSRHLGTSSGEMRQMVVRARTVQHQRFASSPVRFNSQMTSRQIREFCSLTPESQSLLKTTMEDLGLSARAHDKILRVARTIADLEGTNEIELSQLHEAVNYRLLDRDLFA